MKWRLEYTCGAKGCKAKGYCDDLFANWPTCRCAATVTAWSTATRGGDQQRHGRPRGRAVLPVPPQAHVRAKFCGVGMNALANSGLSAAPVRASRRTSAHIKPKCPPLPCCAGQEKVGQEAAGRRPFATRNCHWTRTAKPLS